MVIGYRQMRWFFATRRRSWLLLVLSVLLDLGLLLLLDSSANSTASLAQNRQLLRNTIIKEKLKDFKLLQILLRLAGSCGLKVWGSSSFPRLLGFVPGS